MDADLSIALTPLGFAVRISRARWETIVSSKHPIMRGRESDVHRALRDPDVVRRSKTDQSVLLFYRQDHPGRWLCAVVKRIDGDGFLITTYPTDTIKIGVELWSK